MQKNDKVSLKFQILKITFLLKIGSSPKLNHHQRIFQTHETQCIIIDPPLEKTPRTPPTSVVPKVSWVQVEFCIFGKIFISMFLFLFYALKFVCATVDAKDRFHQHFTQRYYVCRSQKQKIQSSFFPLWELLS